MEWLRRNAAPLSAKVWKEIDEIAGSMFKQTLVGRRITDFDGPRGWNHVATQLGTFKPAQAPKSSYTACVVSRARPKACASAAARHSAIPLAALSHSSSTP